MVGPVPRPAGRWMKSGNPSHENFSIISRFFLPLTSGPEGGLAAYLR